MGDAASFIPGLPGSAGEAPSLSGSLRKQYNAYLQYLPQLLGATVDQQGVVDRAALESAKTISPGYSQLALEQMQKFGVPYAQAGSDIARASALGGAGTNVALLEGAGGDAVRAADALNREVNPEYYTTRSAASNQLQNLINSINLGGLSGGETAAVERALNQSNTATGNLGVDNATTAVSNAMNFGEALDRKRTMLSNALSTATNFMSGAQNSAFSPVGVALSSVNQPNTGTNAFQPVTSSGNQALQFGSGVLGNAAGNASTQMPLQAEANYRNSPSGQIQGLLSSVNCCFIFLEAFNGKLPWWVRECRDFYYHRYPEVAVGYKRMAKWLVPLMKRSKVISKLVNKFMVKPITQYGGYVLCVRGYEHCGNRRKYLDFWFNVWRKLAK